MEEGGEVLIEKYKDLLPANSLGILTDHLLIMENLGVLLRLLEACLIKLIEWGKGFVRKYLLHRQKEERTYRMLGLLQTFSKYPLNGFIK